MKLLSILFALLLLTPQNPKSEALTIKSSQVSFKIKNAGMTVDGTFGGLDGEIIFNPLKPGNASIKVSVASNTVNTGNSMRDGHLKKAEYFDVAKYPKISMQSVKIEKTGPISFTGTFKLTIKDVTKEIKVPFLYLKTADKAQFKGDFSINRLDYKVGESSFTLSDNVTVSIVADINE